MIHTHYTSETHLTIAKEHIQRCIRAQKCELLAYKIAHLVEILQGEHRAQEALKEKKTCCYNNMLLMDAELDNTIRFTLEQLRQYTLSFGNYQLPFNALKTCDLDNATSVTNRFNVDYLIKTILGLYDKSKSQSLLRLIEPLQKADKKYKHTKAIFEEATKSWQLALVEEERAKNNLRIQYMHHHEIAKKSMDDKIIKELFPVLKGTRSIENIKYISA